MLKRLLVILLALAQAVRLNADVVTRFAVLVHDLGKGTTPAEKWPRHIGHEARSIDLTRNLCERIRIPRDSRDLALLVARYHGDVHRAEELKPSTLADILQAVDAYRRHERFEEFLQACACDFHGRPGFAVKPYPQAERLQKALAAAKSVDAGKIAVELSQKLLDSKELPAAIHAQVSAMRIAAIKSELRNP